MRTYFVLVTQNLFGWNVYYRHMHATLKTVRSIIKRVIICLEYSFKDVIFYFQKCLDCFKLWFCNCGSVIIDYFKMYSSLYNCDKRNGNIFFQLIWLQNGKTTVKRAEWGFTFWILARNSTRFLWVLVGFFGKNLLFTCISFIFFVWIFFYLLFTFWRQRWAEGERSPLSKHWSFWIHTVGQVIYLTITSLFCQVIYSHKKSTAAMCKHVLLNPAIHLQWPVDMSEVLSEVIHTWRSIWIIDRSPGDVICWLL